MFVLWMGRVFGADKIDIRKTSGYPVSRRKKIEDRMGERLREEIYNACGKGKNLFMREK